MKERRQKAGGSWLVGCADQEFQLLTMTNDPAYAKATAGNAMTNDCLYATPIFFVLFNAIIIIL